MIVVFINEENLFIPTIAILANKEGICFTKLF